MVAEAEYKDYWCSISMTQLYFDSFLALMCKRGNFFFFYLLLNTFIWATDSQSWVVLTPMEHLVVSGDMDVCKQELFKTFNYLPQMLVVPRLRKPAVSFFCLITELSALPLYFIDTEYPDFFTTSLTFAIYSSRGSSWPRDWTCVSCIPGRFFPHWGIVEVQLISILFFWFVYIFLVLTHCLSLNVSDLWNTKCLFFGD